MDLQSKIDKLSLDMDLEKYLKRYQKYDTMLSEKENELIEIEKKLEKVKTSKPKINKIDKELSFNEVIERLEELQGIIENNKYSDLNELITIYQESKNLKSYLENKVSNTTLLLEEVS